MLNMKNLAAPLLLLALLFSGLPASALADDQALTLYHQGIEANSIGAREQLLEEALQLYLARFNQMKEEGKMNGWLCYNIGNCYFNLKQLGEAIYYYRLGLNLLPANAKIRDNLEVALSKRQNGVDIEPPGIKATLLFFHYRFSAASRINSLIIAALVASLFLLGLILKPNTLFRYGSILSCLVALSLMSSLGVDYYAPRHVGVVLHQTEVRKDAGLNFASINPAPLSPGSSIEVLSLNGDWYRVKLNDGRQGYIHSQDMKVVI